MPRCINAGYTLNEARAMAMEVLAGHLAMLEAEGEPVPRPSPLEAFKSDSHRSDAVLIQIDLPENFLKPEQITVIIPCYLLSWIGVSSDGSRSRFFVEAAEQKPAG